MADWRAAGLSTLTDGMLFTQRERVVELALKGKLPGVYPEAEFVAAGGLASYGPSLPDLFRRAASYVDKILKGAKPGDLPIEQPTKFELAINLKIAQALGLALGRFVCFWAKRTFSPVRKARRSYARCHLPTAD